MLRRATCLLGFLILCVAAASAQRTIETATRQPRILLLLDGSSSMLQPWNKTIRFKAAAKVISALMDSIYAVNPGVEFGLRVYGHQSPAQLNDCFDTRQEVMFSKNNATQMDLRLASLKPYGVSPIAFSLREAAENDLVDEVRNAYSVILVTDGGESCGGNICDVVKSLIERKIYFKPYILSLVNYAPLKDQYACLGTYLQVANDGEIAPAIHRIVEDYRPLLSMPIMAVKADPITPRGDPKTVSIPAWVPDRSSLAALTLRIERPRELPLSFSRPIPRRVPPPPSPAVTKPTPEPVRIAEQPLSPLEANMRLRVLTLRLDRPGPRRLGLVPLVAVAPPPPEPLPKDFLASLDIVARRNQLPALFARRTPTSVAVQALTAVTRPAPLPEALPALSIQKRQAEIYVQYDLPVPLSRNRPQLTPIVPPIPEQESLANLVVAGRRRELPAVLPGLSLRRVAIPRPAPIARSIPEPIPYDAITALAPKRSPEAPVTFRSRPVPTRLAAPRLDAIARSVPEPVPAFNINGRVGVPPNTTTSAPIKDTARSSIVIKRIDPQAPVASTRPKPLPTTPSGNKPKEPAFTSETEDANETSLAILFTDGRGKFYASTPQLQLMDAATGKLIKQFYRTVDAAGNPDPQNVPPGTYNLLVAGRSNMLMRRVTVEKNKKNKIIVKVSHGSLRFRYENAPDRPVTEFDAIVNIRFEPGPTVKQRCTAELEYPPGNYYIEINTLPVSRFNTDIDFGAITEIQIPEPGFVQFTNTNPVGTISLYTPLGNKFVRFYGLKITGRPDDQRLRLRPGTYEVHWVKNPNMPFATETIERFVVKSNSMTEVHLQ